MLISQSVRGLELTISGIIELKYCGKAFVECLYINWFFLDFRLFESISTPVSYNNENM